MCFKKKANTAEQNPNYQKIEEVNGITKTFDKNFWRIFRLFIIFILIILSFPFLFTNLYFFHIDFSKTGQIGDTLGGIMGPFIAIAAAILTFLAFWVQFIANKKQDIQIIAQNTQIKNQDDQWKIERFESKFYSLIEIHRNNVSEINIQGVKGDVFS